MFLSKVALSNKISPEIENLVGWLKEMSNIVQKKLLL